jgi:hypothetical protein
VAAQRFGGLTSANVVDTRQPQKRGLPKECVAPTLLATAGVR